MACWLPMSIDMKDEWTEMRDEIERSVVRLRALIAEAHALNKQMETPPVTRAALNRIRTAHHSRSATSEGGHNPCF